MEVLLARPSSVVGTGSHKIVCTYLIAVYLSADFLPMMSWYSYLLSVNIHGIFFLAFLRFFRTFQV